jgi:hypothetical protein
VKSCAENGRQSTEVAGYDALFDLGVYLLMDREVLLMYLATCEGYRRTLKYARIVDSVERDELVDDIAQLYPHISDDSYILKFKLTCGKVQETEAVLTVVHSCDG